MKPFLRKAVLITLTTLLVIVQTGCSLQKKEQRLPVRVLILPKFEINELQGDFPGEAQDFYEAYLTGAETYEIEGCGDNKLYYKDGIAMFLLGIGKVNAALNTAAVLSDKRFDFSDAYVLSVGCGGSAEGYGIFGDVFVITAVADYDKGHHADPREMSEDTDTTWFVYEYGEDEVVRLNQDLTDNVYEMIIDVPLKTTEKTRKYLEEEYPGEAWAIRDPKVMRGTCVTADNYWKGKYDHQNAILITQTYQCADPYAISEMEDIASAQAIRRAGLLDRLIILRVSVNLDVFPMGVTPEMLWGADIDDSIASEDSMESVDIFETAMENCFNVGKVLIDAILEGTL